MMRILSHGLSRKGEVRAVNQDSIFLSTEEEYGIFLVADGVGGLAEGERASRKVRDVLIDWWYSILDRIKSLNEKEIEEDIIRILSELNQEMFGTKKKKPYSASTLVALLLLKDKYLLINIGDSRCYYLGSNETKVDTLSEDDVWENLPQLKDIPKEELEHNRNFGKLTQAMGGFQKLNPNISFGLIQAGSIFFLCSDGIYKFCDKVFLETELIQIRDGTEMEESIGRIERKVIENGSGDNYSAITVKITDDNRTELVEE